MHEMAGSRGELPDAVTLLPLIFGLCPPTSGFGGGRSLVHSLGEQRSLGSDGKQRWDGETATEY